MKPMADTDLMPWGMHRSVPMQDVPASYFHYLWTSGLKSEALTNPVAAYIYANLDALKKEHPDGIWA
jgi:hypothetical protein